MVFASAVAEEGEGGVGDDLDEEAFEFGDDVGEGVTHGDDAHIAVHAKGGGKEAGNPAPKFRHIAAGPRQARQEQHRHRQEHE